MRPFILWPRLPYDLTLIVDWMAQAQLYKFAKEESTQRLRSKGIDNICALYAALSNADAAASVWRKPATDYGGRRSLRELSRVGAGSRPRVPSVEVGTTPESAASEFGARGGS